MIEVYYGDNRFGTVTDSGTATLKPRPRVRPLLTFLPLVSAPVPAGRSWCPEPAGLAAALSPHPRESTEEKQERSVMRGIRETDLFH